MKTHTRRQQHKKNFKHQDIKQKEPPQKYRLGTISNTKLLAGLNRFYMAITSNCEKSVKNNLKIISKLHAHLQSMFKTSVKFQKKRNKTVGGVAYTRYILL